MALRVLSMCAGGSLASRHFESRTFIHWAVSSEAPPASTEAAVDCSTVAAMPRGVVGLNLGIEALRMQATLNRNRHAPATASCAKVQASRWHHQLRCTCKHLGIPAQDADRILADETLQVGGIGLALRLNPDVQQGEFYADCGQPEPWQEADLHRELLQEALVNDTPSVCLAVHPQSRHVVVKSCLPLPAADEEGWLCTVTLLATITRAHDIAQRFTLLPGGNP